jgi:hypothetical protein
LATVQDGLGDGVVGLVDADKDVDGIWIGRGLGAFEGTDGAGPL